MLSAPATTPRDLDWIRRHIDDDDFATVTDVFAVLCECGDAGCVTQIRIASDAYERVRGGPTLFIVVPGHETAEIEEIVDKQDAYYVVRKEAEVAKRVAEKTDPRSP